MRASSNYLKEKDMPCRICGGALRTILDLGKTPAANSLTATAREPIESFPLVLQLCMNCTSLQLRDCLSIEDLYKNYYYLTPESRMLQEHYWDLTNFLLSNVYLTSLSNVVEVGSNIGTYLKFLKPHVRSVLGVDPAENIAKMANDLGLPTVCEFFNTSTARNLLRSNGAADVIIARHCFAHNSNPHELLQGAKALLALNGSVVIENAYALNTIENNEFDQIYHEHMFYYSIQSMKKALELNGFVLVNVLISLVHGGSIVFVAKHLEENPPVASSVNAHLLHEKNILNDEAFLKFETSAYKLKSDLLALVKSISESGKSIFTYGATAKGNTLLNFVGITSDDIKFCVDSTEIKHGKFLPGSGIRVVPENYSNTEPPDYYLLTAWNYKNEIIRKVRASGNFKSAFIVPFPTLHIV